MSELAKAISRELGFHVPQHTMRRFCDDLGLDVRRNKRRGEGLQGLQARVQKLEETVQFLSKELGITEASQA